MPSVLDVRNSLDGAVVAAPMQAFAVPERDGPPAVVTVPDPAPGPGQVRVAVEAASLNGYDVAIATGRLWDSVPHEFPVVLGRDFAGTVDAVGADVRDVSVGDRVAGGIHGAVLHDGALAERVVVDASTLAWMPDEVPVVQAAAIGLAGAAAYDVAAALDVAPDDAVLVSGATGGVGTYLVQLLSTRGARVIATAQPGAEENAVRRLGAAAAVDYTGDVPGQLAALAPGGVDKVAHAAGDVTALVQLLAPGGRLVTLLGAPAAERDDITVVPVVAKVAPATLTALLAEVASGGLQAVVSATYPLAKAADAFDAFRQGGIGKIVVTA